MKSITFIILTTLMSPVYAHTFPHEQVDRHCRIAMHYITYTLDECIKEQFNWFDSASQSPHYTKSLWYGQKRNWRGDVVGIDFKPVVERINYLNK